MANANGSCRKLLPGMLGSLIRRQGEPCQAVVNQLGKATKQSRCKCQGKRLARQGANDLVSNDGAERPSDLQGSGGSHGCCAQLPALPPFASNLGPISGWNEISVERLSSADDLIASIQLDFHNASDLERSDSRPD
jgi:hypothetical protein